MPEKSTYKEDREYTYTVAALPVYQERHLIDAQLGRIPDRNEQWDVSYDRLMALQGNNKYHVNFVKEIDRKK